MKKFLIFLLITIAAYNGRAQIEFGIQGGFNMGTLSLGSDNTGGNIPTLTKIGALFGLFADKSINHAISFRSEINFIQKGGRFKPTANIFGINSQASSERLNYLQFIPMMCASSTDDNITFFIATGPEISLGLNGTDNTTLEVKNGVASYNYYGNHDKKIVFDGKANAQDGKTHYKSLNVGVNALIGIRINSKSEISAGYTAGLSNIFPDNSFKTKTRGVIIKLGFLIHKHHNH